MKYRPKLHTSSSVFCVGRHLKVVSSVSRFTSSQSLAMHTMTNTKLSGNSVDRSTLRSHRFTDIHPGDLSPLFLSTLAAGAFRLDMSSMRLGVERTGTKDTRTSGFMETSNSVDWELCGRRPANSAPVSMG